MGGAPARAGAETLRIIGGGYPLAACKTLANSRNVASLAQGAGAGEAWSSSLPEDAYAELTRIRLQINVVQFT